MNKALLIMNIVNYPDIKEMLYNCRTKPGRREEPTKWLKSGLRRLTRLGVQDVPKPAKASLNKREEECLSLFFSFKFKQVLF